MKNIFIISLVIFSIIILIFNKNTFAQNFDRRQLDSMAAQLPKMKDDTVKGMIYQELGRGYSNLDLDMAFYYGTELEKLAKKINWENGIAIANNIYGYVKLKKDQPDSAYNYYKKSNEIYKKTGFKKGFAATYANLGNIALYKSNYKVALQHYLKGLKEFEAINERPNIRTLNMNIGLVFGNMKLYPQSKKYLKESLKLCIEDKDKFGECKSYLNLGNIYQLEKKYLDSAKTFLLKALELSKTIDDINTQYSATINLTSLNLQENNLDAVEELLKSKVILEQTPSPFDYVNLTLIKTELLIKRNPNPSKKVLKETIKTLLNADSVTKSISKKEELAEISKFLSIVYEKLGENKSALHYYKQYIEINDSIDNFDNRQNIKNLEYEREIELKDNQIQLSQIMVKNQQKNQWIFFGILGFIIIVGCTLWYQNNQRKIANKQLSIINKELDESNKVKARFFSILSHDLRAPVASLSNYIFLLNEDNNIFDEENKKAHQLKIGIATNNLLGTIEDILLWSKSQMERFEPIKRTLNVNSLFEDIKKYIPEDILIDIQFQNLEQLTIFSDENYLKTIMRNLTSNAIKVLKGKENAVIKWSAYTENNLKYLSITDNGPGISEEQQQKLFNANAIISTKTGLGLHLVRDLIKMLQHPFKVISGSNKGTTFTIQFEN